MKFIVILLGFVMWAGSAKADTPKIVVLELFTSQGCSSCPSADALLEKLAAEDKSLLPLSMHIDYWNYLGWKDPFSSPANTEKQKAYNRNFGVRGLYTPELVVDGAVDMDGNRVDDVQQAIKNAKARISPANVKIDKGTGDRLNVTVSGPIKDGVDIFAVRYNHAAQTAVGAGENNGRMLISINNVVSIENLGPYKNPMSLFVVNKPNADQGLAIIVQANNVGPILGAGVF